MCELPRLHAVRFARTEKMAAVNECGDRTSIKIGILSIQGAFYEHQACLLSAKEEIAVQDKDIVLSIIDVKRADHLPELDGIIIPGGESTVMGKSLERDGFGEAVKSWMNRPSKPVIWGTCAGMILLANDLQRTKTGGQCYLGGLDIQVSRNFFGRQINSFEASVDIKDDNLKGKESNSSTYHGVFIRAPAVDDVHSDDVQILATIDHFKSTKPVIVAVQQKNIMATAFHPELTNDYRWHKYFLQLVISRQFGQCVMT